MNTHDARGNILLAQIADFEATIKQLTHDLEDLKVEVSDVHVFLKRANEDLKDRNTEFQQVLACHHAIVTILNKGLDRLGQFYAPTPLLQRAKSGGAGGASGAGGAGGAGGACGLLG